MVDASISMTPARTALASDDLFVAVDTSENETVHITKADFLADIIGTDVQAWDEQLDGLATLTAQQVTDLLAGDQPLGTGDPVQFATTTVLTGATTATANSVADDLFVKGTGDIGLTIAAGADTNQSSIFLSHPASNSGGRLRYKHSDGVFGIGTARNGGTVLLKADNDITNITLSGAGGSELAVFAGDVNPAITESQDIGSVTKEWDNAYFQNAPTISDERRKNIEGEIDWATDFLRQLDPKVFTYTNVIIPEKTTTEIVSQQVMRTVRKSETVMEEIKGVWTERVILKDVEEGVFEEHPVFNHIGEPVMIKVKGKLVQKIHRVPVMEDVPITTTVPERTISHGRPHTGLIAQHVKAAMDAVGLDDWAGYAYDDESDTHLLRLMELTGVLVKGWKDLDARVKVLETP